MCQELPQWITPIYLEMMTDKVVYLQVRKQEALESSDLCKILHLERDRARVPIQAVWLQSPWSQRLCYLCLQWNSEWWIIMDSYHLHYPSHSLLSSVPFPFFQYLQWLCLIILKTWELSGNCCPQPGRSGSVSCRYLTSAPRVGSHASHLPWVVPARLFHFLTARAFLDSYTLTLCPLPLKEKISPLSWFLRDEKMVMVVVVVYGYVHGGLWMPYLNSFLYKPHW